MRSKGSRELADIIASYTDNKKQLEAIWSDVQNIQGLLHDGTVRDMEKNLEESFEKLLATLPLDACDVAEKAKVLIDEVISTGELPSYQIKALRIIISDLIAWAETDLID